MHHLSILSSIALLSLHASQIIVLASSIEMAIWEAPMNNYFKTCSAIITDVDGCFGWSKNFCKTTYDDNNDFSCDDCQGVLEATVANCSGVRLTLDFNAETPWIYFRNDDDVDVRQNCTLKYDGEGDVSHNAHHAGSWCDPYKPCEGPTCFAPEKPEAPEAPEAPEV